MNEELFAYYKALENRFSLMFDTQTLTRSELLVIIRSEYENSVGLGKQILNEEL